MSLITNGFGEVGNSSIVNFKTTIKKDIFNIKKFKQNFKPNIKTITFKIKKVQI